MWENGACDANGAKIVCVECRFGIFDGYVQYGTCMRGRRVRTSVLVAAQAHIYIKRDSPIESTPAFETTISIFPASSMAVSTAFFTLSLSLTSSTSVLMLGCLKVFIDSRRRAVAYTMHPFWANSSHLATSVQRVLSERVKR